MKKVIYVLILPLVVVSGLVFANREIKNETTMKPSPKPLSAAEREAERKKWEATPDGIMYKKWEASPAGQKVYAAEAKIRKNITDSTNLSNSTFDSDSVDSTINIFATGQIHKKCFLTPQKINFF